jgi:hypothetical protein
VYAIKAELAICGLQVVMVQFAKSVYHHGHEGSRRRDRTIAFAALGVVRGWGFFWGRIVKLSHYPSGDALVKSEEWRDGAPPSAKPVARRVLFRNAFAVHSSLVTHAKLVAMAVHWLRSYRCGVVLSEQACVSGEMPDAIGWKKACHSVLVECKVSRADFLADRDKLFRQKPEVGVGCERYYLTPKGLAIEELPAGWGLLEVGGRGIERVKASAKNLRSAVGFQNEMNLLLASLRRVEIRIEPETITDFLKWKNRLAQYNRGTLPLGLVAEEKEGNEFLLGTAGD